jgi:hypothetical protein
MTACGFPPLPDVFLLFPQKVILIAARDRRHIAML